MKNVLILVLSSDFHPYDKMIKTSIDTWDSIDVEHTETVFYCGASSKKDTDKIIYLPVDNDLFSIGKKTLLAFEWALKNKEFDYISRPQANAYIHKTELVKYIQTLPDNGVFDTMEVKATDTSERYGWGCATLLSRDVVQMVVDNKDKWDHTKMEDVSLSQLIDRLGIPYREGKICSINKTENGYLCLCYGGGENFEFTDFKDINKANGQYWFRCKQDYNRDMDAYIMKQLFKNLY